MTAMAFLAGSCGGESSIPGEPCAKADDCAPIGDAVCLDGICTVFSEQTGYGSAVVDLSFDRDVPQVPASGLVHFVHPQLADGTQLTCEDIRSGKVVLGSEKVNPLQSHPRYLVFNCCGTYFPNNLVQFIRPALGNLVVAEGYQRLDAQGTMTTFGCVEGVDITKDQTLEDLVVSLDVR